MLKGTSLLFTMASCLSTLAIAAPDHWVTAQRLDRHTCPAQNCGVVGSLLFREGVSVLESKDGWSRITKPYSAFCMLGKSDVVAHGNKACTTENGITGAQLSEWVKSDGLSIQRPADPAAAATGDELLVKGSDDYLLHHAAFATAARQLIDEGTCTAADFQNFGGWMATTTRGPGVYFTYCGGMTLANKIYLNAATGEMSR